MQTGNLYQRRQASAEQTTPVLIPIRSAAFIGMHASSHLTKKPFTGSDVGSTFFHRKRRSHQSAVELAPDGKRGNSAGWFMAGRRTRGQVQTVQNQQRPFSKPTSKTLRFHEARRSGRACNSLQVGQLKSAAGTMLRCDAAYIYLFLFWCGGGHVGFTADAAESPLPRPLWATAWRKWGRLSSCLGKLVRCGNPDVQWEWWKQWCFLLLNPPPG